MGQYVAPPPSQEEALSRYSASGEVPRQELEVERALGTFDATHKVPRNTGLPREEHRGFPFFSFLVKVKRLIDFSQLVRADTTESFAKTKLHNVHWIPIIELYAT